MVDRVVRQVARVTNRDRVALPPLCESVDPESLAALLRSGPRSRSLSVEFEYAGHHVCVFGDGRVGVDVDRVRDVDG